MFNKVLGLVWGEDQEVLIVTTGDTINNIYMTTVIQTKGYKILHQTTCISRIAALQEHLQRTKEYIPDSIPKSQYSMGMKPANDFKSSPTVICPLCSSKMKLRTGGYGQFYGCAKYPSCPAVCNIDGTPNTKTKKLMKNFVKKDKKEKIKKKLEPLVEYFKGIEIDDVT